VSSVPPQGGRKHPQQELIQVDTRNILFICGGAFSGLGTVIQERSEKSGIGFGANVNSKTDSGDGQKFMSQLEPEDLVKYGLIPEFIGRLPVIATLEHLDKDALIQILTEPKNALVKQYQKLFSLDGVELEIREDALEAIAEKALKRKTGARGLRSIMENALLDTMYELPSLKGVTRVIVDKSTIEEGATPMYKYVEADTAA